MIVTGMYALKVKKIRGSNPMLLAWSGVARKQKMLNKLSDLIQRKIVWKTPQRAMWLYEHVPGGWLESLRVANLKSTIKLTQKKSLFYAQDLGKSRVCI